MHPERTLTTCPHCYTTWCTFCCQYCPMERPWRSCIEMAADIQREHPDGVLAPGIWCDRCRLLAEAEAQEGNCDDS